MCTRFGDSLSVKNCRISTDGGLATGFWFTSLDSMPIPGGLVNSFPVGLPEPLSKPVWNSDGPSLGLVLCMKLWILLLVNWKSREYTKDGIGKDFLNRILAI